MRKYIYHTLVIVTLTLGHVGLCSESDRISKTIILSSNINIKTETKMYSIRNINTRKLQRIRSEKLEFNITRNKKWDQEPSHIAKKLKADIKPDNLPLHTDENQNIQRYYNKIEPRAYNISSILDTARNYHNLIGIPLAKKIRQNNNIRKLKCRIKGKTKSECRGRVAGGLYSRIGDFPFVAGLRISLVGGLESICGASLISRNRLVTAGHCWYDANNRSKNLIVILGSLNIDDNTGTKIATKDVVVHPKFDANFALHDIAIIRLKNKITISKKIQIINLPLGKMSMSSFKYREAVVIGYGAIDPNSNNHDVIQSYKKVKVMKNGKCARYYGNHYVASSVICAEANQGSACGGDSGGPLAFQWHNKYYLIGVVSFGPPQCGNNLPSGFSRITAYLDWIESHL